MDIKHTHKHVSSYNWGGGAAQKSNHKPANTKQDFSAANQMFYHQWHFVIWSLAFWKSLKKADKHSVFFFNLSYLYFVQEAINQQKMSKMYLNVRDY